jgi:hypothetical protein
MTPNFVCGAIIFSVAFASAFFEFPEAKERPFDSRMALMICAIWFATLVRQILLRRQERHPDNDGG